MKCSLCIINTISGVNRQISVITNAMPKMMVKVILAYLEYKGKEFYLIEL